MLEAVNKRNMVISCNIAICGWKPQIWFLIDGYIFRREPVSKGSTPLMVEMLQHCSPKNRPIFGSTFLAALFNL
jgi:hypothetical protein